MKQAAVPAPPAPPIQPPATPIQPHLLPINDDTEENPFRTPTIHPPDRHVTFNLTPAVAPPPISNSELGDSPWLHSPSDALPPVPPPAPAAPNPNPQTPAREDFTWVFETGTGTPGASHQARTPCIPSPSPVHRTHGSHTPRSGPHSTHRPQPLKSSGPAGNKKGKKSGDVEPFFKVDGKGVRSCIFCEWVIFWMLK